MSLIHDAAERGFSAGAALYAGARPDYPAAIDDWLRDRLGLGPGRDVIDLGAGTGIFTRHLLSTGANVIAVEPVASMRMQLAQRLPGVLVLDGRAEAMPLADASVDALVCAQAFHWFATPAALAEIARVLRPGGTLGLIWNLRDERTPWVAALTRLLERHEGETPRERSGAWRRLFPAGAFGPLVEQHFANTHEGPAERVIVDRSLSVSFIAALPEDERAAFAKDVRALIAETPGLAGCEPVAMPYVTYAYSCRRLG